MAYLFVMITTPVPPARHIRMRVALFAAAVPRPIAMTPTLALRIVVIIQAVVNTILYPVVSPVPPPPPVPPMFVITRPPALPAVVRTVPPLLLLAPPLQRLIVANP